MFGQEGEELADVAPVGLQGLARHAPFGAEIVQPADDFGLNVGGEGQFFHVGQTGGPCPVNLC